MRVKDVCKIVIGYSSEEVYYGWSAGFCVRVCAEVTLYLGLYKDVDL